MKVQEISTGKIVEVNCCYGARLIEQGKAVLYAPPRPPGKRRKSSSGERAR